MLKLRFLSILTQKKLHDAVILLLRPESFGFFLSCANYRLCYLNLAGITKFKCERKNEKNSGRSSKMTPSCKWPVRIFLYLSYSFGIETINTFIHSRSSLENHTRFQTKMGKVYSRFQLDQNGAKALPDGRQVPI